jgi:hypothetical protein
MVMFVPPISIAPKLLTADAPGEQRHRLRRASKRQGIEELAIDHAPWRMPRV